MRSTELTQKRLKQVLELDEKTLKFRWKRPSNGRREKVGCVRSDGRLVIRIDDVLQYEDRLICLYMTGEWPKRDHRERFKNPGGYVMIYAKGHPMAHRNHYAFEHRVVLYDAIGPGPMMCELCGRDVTWRTVHVDHIDETVDNNERSNLRPTCSTCNTRRGMRPAHTWDHTTKIEFEGVIKTANEWAKDPRVKVSRNAICHRLRRGMSDADALFAPKKTHNGKGKKRHIRPKSHKGKV